MWKGVGGEKYFFDEDAPLFEFFIYLQHEEISAHKNTDICIVTNAILSGTVSEIGGGKFANGAITGAFAVMFNDLMHSIKFKNINYKIVVKELQKLYDNYDETTNPMLYKNMGGQIYSEVYLQYPDRTKNACTLKLCLALEKAGFYIPANTPNTLKAKNGRYYFVSAQYMFDYLKKEYKQYYHSFTNYQHMRVQMSHGIYFQSGAFRDATGHIDAMWNRQVGGHIYKNQPINEAIY